MNWFQSLVLGIVQGLTEFLPVSSSGHLVLAQHLMGIPETSVAFDVMLHLATLLAVLVYFRSRLWLLIRNRRLALALIAGTVPAGLAGVLFEDFFKSLFQSVSAVGLALVGTGFILFFAELVQARIRRPHSMEAISMADAVWIGIGQAVAIIPGISRSGSTISAAMARGIQRKDAAEFSFLLSIPVILGAGVLELRHVSSTFGLHELPALLVGGLAAMGSGLVAIKILLAVVERRRLTTFSWYVWVLGVLALSAGFLGR